MRLGYPEWQSFQRGSLDAGDELFRGTSLEWPERNARVWLYLDPLRTGHVFFEHDRKLGEKDSTLNKHITLRPRQNVFRNGTNKDPVNTTWNLYIYIIYI